MPKKRSSEKHRNVVGPQIRILRDKQDWSQPELATKCQLQGWNVSRDIIARVELQLRWVADFELMIFARVFGVTPNDLLPVRLNLASLSIAEE